MVTMRIKFFLGIFCFFIVSCTATSNLIQNNQIRLGMSINTVCETTAFTTNMVEDPCLGSSYQNLDKGLRVLSNANQSIFLIFKGLPNKNPTNRESILVYIASSKGEAEFYISSLDDIRT